MGSLDRPAENPGVNVIVLSPCLQRNHNFRIAIPTEVQETLNMSPNPSHGIHSLRPRSAGFAGQARLRGRVRDLLHEREDLREEIRQLRASVQVYAEIVRRLERCRAA